MWRPFMADERIDETGSSNSNGSILEEVVGSALKSSGFTNESYFKKLSELYGDVMANKGLNVADPLMAKMVYYDKHQMFAVDPNVLVKGYIFFTRPELNFTAENILRSSILEYYFNTKLGRYVMSMLADPFDTIGVYSEKIPKWSAMVEKLNEVKSAGNRFINLERLLTKEVNDYQDKQLETIDGWKEKVTAFNEKSNAAATAISEASNMSSQSVEKQNDIIKAAQNAENEFDTAAQDLVKLASESGLMVNYYNYMGGTTDADLIDEKYVSDADAKRKEANESIQLATPETGNLYARSTAADFQSGMTGGVTGSDFYEPPTATKLKSKRPEERIEEANKYLTALENVIIKDNDLSLDPTLPLEGICFAKDVIKVFNPMTGLEEPANYTTPFIPLLSNTCLSCSGFKDFNLESFMYDSDYHGASINVATGQDDVYGPGEITCEFEDVYGGPVSILFLIWIEYISKVSRGKLTASKRNILNLVLDYTTSIYVFNTGRDMSTIKYWAKLTGAYPVTFPIGQFIQFSREPNLENAKNLSITFKYNRYEPMEIAAMADFNYLSIQEFSRRPEANYEEMFKDSDKWKAYQVKGVNRSGRGRSMFSKTSLSVNGMRWSKSPFMNPGISGKVPYPIMDGSIDERTGLRTTEMTTDYWGGYPYIHNLTKLLWVSPHTNPDDEVYSYIMEDPALDAKLSSGGSGSQAPKRADYTAPYAAENGWIKRNIIDKAKNFAIETSDSKGMNIVNGTVDAAKKTYKFGKSKYDWYNKLKEEQRRLFNEEARKYGLEELDE